jgi:hypothetical protein
LNASKPDSKN